uniref:Glycerophosphodiester phosphodiesterase domain containing 3a n=1 Tax=Paramormyrops kingsleyae TaxID=1676925 RepID=A0A3B3T8N1_9TELE
MASSLYYIIPALGGYALASFYLLKNPHILHKKKRVAFYCRHISHRAGSGERIESTMEAFRHAEEAGTHMLEMDCHMTKDGHVIVSHDENLLRQTGVDVNISSVNLEDLPLYKERLEVTFREGYFSTGTDRKFALLEDVFRSFPKMPINIEIKEDNDQLIKKNPSMPYMFTMVRGLQLLLLYYTGLLPFIPLGESFLQSYLPHVFNRTYIPDSPILRNRFVHLFVCNELTDIEEAFARGATGVMTDYPTLLTDYLRTHPQITPPCSH